VLDPQYVTGFVDGAGSFTYSRSGRQLALYFAIKLPIEEREHLLDLQDFFQGVGRIYDTSTQTCFRVTHREELAAIIAHFDGYPLRRKQRSYEIWREMVILKRSFRMPDRTQLDELASQLSSRRSLT